MENHNHNEGSVLTPPPRSPDRQRAGAIRNSVLVRIDQLIHEFNRDSIAEDDAEGIECPFLHNWTSDANMGIAQSKFINGHSGNPEAGILSRNNTSSFSGVARPRPCAASSLSQTSGSIRSCSIKPPPLNRHSTPDYGLNTHGKVLSQTGDQKTPLHPFDRRHTVPYRSDELRRSEIYQPRRVVPGASPWTARHPRGASDDAAISSFDTDSDSSRSSDQKLVRRRWSRWVRPMKSALSRVKHSFSLTDEEKATFHSRKRMQWQ
ncbi:hypothetical protein B0J15DRAFT_468325 [Fusarium solani]|uniref:Uncharacterized protein n=1 Tax=Fusarium solani TaxID=169388 RepID=A0A9P9H0V8_FUSSL|nr:uncharacterized protein B0J15DRAFT_468325 [Fusarium solani]KAH7248318.1 hypothetical protein B0J15DRAFT_468325 [Fusarium solani]